MSRVRTPSFAPHEYIKEKLIKSIRRNLSKE
jgi:hypothetical protein